MTDEDNKTKEEDEKVGNVSTPKKNAPGNKGKKDPWNDSEGGSDEIILSSDKEDGTGSSDEDSKEGCTDNISKGTKSNKSNSEDEMRPYEKSNASDVETSEHVKVDEGKKDNIGRPTRSTRGIKPTRLQTSYDVENNESEAQGMKIRLLQRHIKADKVCFKKTGTRYSSVLLLPFVSVFFETDFMICISYMVKVLLSFRNQEQKGKIANTNCIDIISC